MTDREVIEFAKKYVARALEEVNCAERMYENGKAEEARNHEVRADLYSDMATMMLETCEIGPRKE